MTEDSALQPEEERLSCCPSSGEGTASSRCCTARACACDGIHPESGGTLPAERSVCCLCCSTESGES